MPESVSKSKEVTYLYTDALLAFNEADLYRMQIAQLPDMRMLVLANDTPEARAYAADIYCKESRYTDRSGSHLPSLFIEEVQLRGGFVVHLAIRAGLPDKPIPGAAFKFYRRLETLRLDGSLTPY